MNAVQQLSKCVSVVGPPFLKDLIPVQLHMHLFFSAAAEKKKFFYLLSKEGRGLDSLA